MRLAAEGGEAAVVVVVRPCSPKASKVVVMDLVVRMGVTIEE
jgi:hypothetical protein